jgi:hypothetical protein
MRHSDGTEIQPSQPESSSGPIRRLAVPDQVINLPSADICIAHVPDSAAAAVDMYLDCKLTRLGSSPCVSSAPADTRGVRPWFEAERHLLLFVVPRQERIAVSGSGGSILTAC